MNIKKYDWSNKDVFLADWNKSKNICNFLLSNNLTATSGNYTTFKKWLKIHTINEDISTSTNGNIFIKDSVVNRGLIYKIIIKEKLIEYKCAECENEGIWKGRPLKLQLEHKNGISDDHRLENLTFLCPNCHSQTFSYGSKNYHVKILQKRVSILKDNNLTFIKKSDIQLIANIWNVKEISCRRWLSLHCQSLKENSITLEWQIKDILEQKNIKNKSKEIYVSSENMKIIRINDIIENLLEEDIVSKLSEIWSLNKKNVKIWVIQNIKDEISQSIKDKFKINIKFYPNINNRIIDLRDVNSRQDVLKLSKIWKLSDNGMKKWIKNHAPEKFSQIYSCNNFKYKKIQLEKEKKYDFYSSLNKDSFNLEEFLITNKTNKKSLFALLKKHNLELYNFLTNYPSCSNCGGKTRSYGIYKTKNQIKNRYKCLECKKTMFVSIP